MKKVLDFLRDNKVFYLATVDGDKPRVRPFGVAIEYKGKLCICTSSVKDVYRQLTVNPNAEISATAPDGAFLRVAGPLAVVRDAAVQAAFFEALPLLREIFAGDAAATFTALAFETATATFQACLNGQRDTTQLY
jgi:uncharacterized pyridoxamine 5'-phosphate oxidase family protein